MKRFAGFLFFIRAIRAFFRLVREPRKIEAVYQISEDPRVANRSNFETVLKHVKSHASTNQLLETRYEGIWEKPRTGNAPEGSLLAQYAKFLDRNHIEKPLAPPLPGSDPEVGYVRNRLRKTHDLWHVITGFDTTVEGELGLQAVYLAQMEVRLSSILIGAGFLHTALFAPAEMHPLVRKIVEGWRIGQSASPLFGFKFEENWMRDLGEIRTSLGLPVGGVG